MRLYRDLSLDIHTHPLGHMQQKKVLSQIRPEQCDLWNVSKKMLDVTRAANLTLCLFHKERMVGFPPEERRTILSLLTPTNRRVL